MNHSFQTVFGFLVTVCFTFFSTGCEAANSSSKNANILELVSQAYGEKLTDIESIRIKSDLRFTFQGQGYSSRYVELEPEKRDLILDYKNDRGSIEEWSDYGGAVYHVQNIYDQKNSTYISHLANTHLEQASDNLYQAFGYEMFHIDTLLARELLLQDQIDDKGTSTL